MENIDSEIENHIICVFEKYMKDINIEKVNAFIKIFPWLITHDDFRNCEEAARIGNLEMLKLFIDHELYDIRTNDAVLYLTSYYENYECTKYILENGGDIEQLRNFFVHRFAEKVLNDLKLNTAI